MRKAGIAEWVLRRAAGEERGTAMYGDLVEMAAMRGRTWFWMEYLRTLIALTWRTGVALVAAWVVMVALYHLRVDAMMHFPRAWRYRWTYSVSYLWLVTGSLQFVLLTPYVLVKYGLRDKIVRVALPLSAPLIGVVFLHPAQQIALPLGVLAMIVLGAFLLLPKWRSAGASLSVAAAAGMATVYGLMPVNQIVVWHFAHHGPFWLAHPFFSFMPTAWATMVLEMAVMAAVCAWLHRRFVQKDVAVALG